MAEELEGGIPPGALRDDLRLDQIDALLRAHGASIRSVDNHHWQISHGDRSALWLLGDGAARAADGLDPGSLARLQGVLRCTGMLRDPASSAPTATMAAAILWVGAEATRVFWINEQGLTGEGAASIRHWLHGEITLHRERRSGTYLDRVVAMLERIERALLIGALVAEEAPVAGDGNGDGDGDGNGLQARDTPLLRLTRRLEQERPDLRQRVVAILTLERDHLDDALLFTMARNYLHNSYSTFSRAQPSDAGGRRPGAPG